MERYRVVAVFLFAVAASALGPHCFAQTVAGAQVGGVVTDPSGSAIAGAQVRMTETDKQLVRNANTDDQGRYTLPNLPVGPYQLEVTAPGFKNYVQSGIELQVGNNVQINVTMQLGLVSERVEVAAGASMVETRETAVSQVIDEHRIADLPLNGRQPTQLILLSGAAVTAPGGDLVGSKNYFSSTTISVAGGQANGVNYMLDGGDHNDSFSNVNLPFPFPDALQEFSVQTGSLSARYGLHPGGTVSAVTKSGTNQWHGNFFEFLRNGNVNARNFFAPTHDTLKRNQFGGTIGDKIIRDKLFFFAGYQGSRNRSDPPQTISFTPTAAVMNGDFGTIGSGACVSGGKGKTLVDPTTGQPFLNNKVPTSRLNPQAVALAAKYVPLSNDPCGRIAYGIPTTGDEEQLIGRVDWVQNSKHMLFGRYFVADYRNPAVFDGKNLLITTRAGNLQRVQAITLGDTYMFSGATINSFHAGFTRRRNNRGPAKSVTLTSLGVNVASPILDYPGSLAVSNYFNSGCGSCEAAHFNVNSFQLADDVDLIRGRHQFSFGAVLLRNQLNLINAHLTNGSFTFNGQFSGDALLDFMLGLPSDFNQENNLEDALRQTLFQLYVQDTIKLTKRLTINVGLRWAPMFPETEYFGRGNYISFDAFAAGTKSQVYKNAPAGMLLYGDPGIPKSFSFRHLNNWGPRLGIAWNPNGDGRQTMRISGSIVHDTEQMYYTEQETTNPPWAGWIDVPSPVGGFTNPWLGYPGGNPFPGTTRPGPAVIFSTSGRYQIMPLHLNPAYTAQWNVSYQRQITANWLASITYLGNKTSHLWVDGQMNAGVYIPGTCAGKPCSTTANIDQRRPLYLQNPAEGKYYSAISYSDQSANANYNGLLVSIQHRLANNFTLMANYTWSHCISEKDYVGELAQAYYMDSFNRRRDRGSCNFDVRHVSNISMIVMSPVPGKGLMGAIFRDWQLSPMITLRSGSAINVTTGLDNSMTGTGLDRPDQVLSNQYVVNRGVDHGWLNRAAFSPNALGTYGNLGRDTAYGPGQFNFDLSLTRTFRYHERVRLETRAEAFNVINHANFNSPTSSLNSANFGKILGAGDPRILQFVLKLHY